jgi:hypothetical protein
MSNQECENPLTLLKELSFLKELDAQYDNGAKTESDCAAHQVRQRRHEEIKEEIKALAEQKKSDAEFSTS